MPPPGPGPQLRGAAHQPSALGDVPQVNIILRYSPWEPAGRFNTANAAGAQPRARQSVGPRWRARRRTRPSRPLGSTRATVAAVLSSPKARAFAGRGGPWPRRPATRLLLAVDRGPRNEASRTPAAADVGLALAPTWSERPSGARAPLGGLTGWQLSLYRWRLTGTAPRVSVVPPYPAAPASRGPHILLAAAPQLPERHVAASVLSESLTWGAMGPPCHRTASSGASPHVGAPRRQHADPAGCDPMYSTPSRQHRRFCRRAAVIR